MSSDIITDHLSSSKHIIEERQVKKKKEKPWLERILGRLSKLFWSLCTTTDTLEDKTILDAWKYFSDMNVALIGIFKRIFFCTIFIYFTVTVYENATLKQQYISADINSGDCESSKKEYNGVFIADYRGNWIGSPEFINSLGAYTFYFRSLGLDFHGYQALIGTVRDALQMIGERAKHSDLSTNLLMWSSWKLSIPVDVGGFTTIQTLTLSGSPRYIFWNEYIQGTISNLKSDCNVNATSVYYSRAEGALAMQFNLDVIDEFSETCSDKVSIFPALGYDPAVTRNIFTLGVDV